MTNGHLTGYKRLSLCMAVWLWRMSMRVGSLWLMRKFLLCMDVEVLFVILLPTARSPYKQQCRRSFYEQRNYVGIVVKPVYMSCAQLDGLGIAFCQCEVGCSVLLYFYL